MGGLFFSHMDVKGWWHTCTSFIVNISHVHTQVNNKLIFKAFRETVEMKAGKSWTYFSVKLVQFGDLAQLLPYKPARWASLSTVMQNLTFSLSKHLQKEQIYCFWKRSKDVLLAGYNSENGREDSNIQFTSQFIPFQVSRLKLSIHSMWLCSHSVSAFYLEVISLFIIKYSNIFLLEKCVAPIVT